MSKTPWTPGPWEVLPLQDGRRAIYTDAEMGFIGDETGNVWIRPAAEFDDGRFTPREYEA